VEAAWLGVDLLVREFGGEENIRILLLDVSRDELEADLTAQDDLAASGVFRVLREVAPGAVVAAFTVAAERAADFEWISRLARVGQALRAPVFAGVHERLVGCRSIAATPDPDDWTTAVPADVTAAWQTLRKRSEARSLGLALPRIVMRLPYGRGLDAIEAFAFEEMGAGRRHEAYLWGNPAFACAHAVLDRFRGEGWDHVISGAADLGARPVHRFVEDGSTQVQPCGEAWLSDRASERLQEAGLIPVQSIKGRDVIRLASLRCVSAEDESFSGR
jgi:type VI secretion system protein ImpC